MEPLGEKTIKNDPAARRGTGRCVSYKPGSTYSDNIGRNDEATEVDGVGAPDPSVKLGTQMSDEY